jgi:hypothetical protein
LVSFLCLRAFFDGKLVIGIDFVADYFDYQWNDRIWINLFMECYIRKNVPLPPTHQNFTHPKLFSFFYKKNH